MSVEMRRLPELAGENGIFSDGDWVESKDQNPEGDVRLIQLSDVGDGIFRNRSARFLTSKKAEELGCTYLRPGDILIARMPDPLGRACIFPDIGQPAVTAVDVCILRTGDDVDAKWAMHTINAPQFRNQVHAMQSGTTRKRISRKNLGTIEVPTPPFERQVINREEIEKQFTRAHDADTSLERARVALTRYLDLLLQEAADSGGQWPIVRVGDIGAQGEQPVLTGPFGTALGRSSFVDTGVPVLTIGSLTFSGIDMSKSKFVTEGKAAELERYKVRDGDLLFSRMATVGRVGLVTSREAGALINYHLMRLRLDTATVDPRFFLTYVRGSRLVVDYLREVNHGATRPGIDTKSLLNLPIKLPSLSEQQEIVARVDKRSSVLSALEEQVSLNLIRSKRLRSLLLAESFDGRLLRSERE